MEWRGGHGAAGGTRWGTPPPAAAAPRCRRRAAALPGPGRLGPGCSGGAKLRPLPVWPAGASREQPRSLPRTGAAEVAAGAPVAHITGPALWNPAKLVATIKS